MIEPRTALDRLIGALEAFHDTAAHTQDPDADSVLEATDNLADAYVLYDDAVYTSYGIELPLDVYGDDDDDDDDDDNYLDDDDDDDFDFDEDDLEPLDD
ncbi:DNA primase [Flaviflexus sp.]|uniref:DNA primase n=1 Tax=Flaviflexus sp. TaxID=1969482 RepID=UPI003F93511A